MKRLTIIFLFSLVIVSCSFAQKKSDIFLKNKKALAINAGVYSSSYIGLYYLWYNNYQKSNFHFFNDSKEWLQLDKAGHTFSAYYLANFQSEALEYFGFNKTSSIFLGSLISFSYLSSIEILDGFSTQWGASTTDILANFTGAGLFWVQNSYLNNLKITPKYSYHFKSSLDVRPQLLGKNIFEKLIKDYNAQTYWLSLNFGNCNNVQIFKYLNLAIGYGADGMTGGKGNELKYGNYARQRQFYLSLDLNLKAINTQYRWLNFCFRHLNIIKIPMPTLVYQGNQLKFYAFYF